MRRLSAVAAMVFAISSFSAAVGAADPYDWANQTEQEFSNGWVVGPCGGDAPVACVFRDGEWRGTIYHGAMSVSELPVGEDEALEWVAADILEVFREDRAIGCPDYEYLPHMLRARKVAFDQGASVGFSLRKDGRTTDVNPWRLVVQDGYVHFLTIVAGSDEVCVPELEGPTMTIAEWSTFSKAFDELGAVSILNVP